MKIELANFLLEESCAFFAALQLYVRAGGGGWTRSEMDGIWPRVANMTSLHSSMSSRLRDTANTLLLIATCFILG